MPICHVILSGIQSINIFDLTELFFLEIVVESYKKTGPSQCHTCQRFGHGSRNCGNSPRCVKCAGSHCTNEYTKPRDQTPTCANCNGAHTANFRGCQSFSEIVKILQLNHPRLTISHLTNLPILHPYTKIMPFYLLNQYL